MIESGKPQPRDSCPGKIRNHYKENKKSLTAPLGRAGAWVGFPNPTAQSTSLKGSLSLSLFCKYSSCFYFGGVFYFKFL
jgi:hypothetical protein